MSYIVVRELKGPYPATDAFGPIEKGSDAHRLAVEFEKKPPRGYTAHARVLFLLSSVPGEKKWIVPEQEAARA